MPYCIYIGYQTVYSGTPPYDHLVNMTTFYFPDPEQHKIKVFFLSKDPVNTTEIFWPNGGVPLY